MAHVSSKAQILRQTIEAEMAQSFAGALSPRPFVQRTLLSCGITELDLLTGGGVPAGAITELVGHGSTGKTGVAMQIAAAAMQAGKVCAWVDASDSFDPQSGAENGMLLPRLLWVRCGGHAEAAPSGPSRSMVLPEADRRSSPGAGRCGSHPRGEEQGLDRAIGGLFQSAGGQEDELPWPDGSRTGMHSTRNRQALGTPGAPNIPLSPCKRAPHEHRPAFHPVTRSEQVASDRQGGRNLGHVGAGREGVGHVECSQQQRPGARSTAAISRPAIPETRRSTADGQGPLSRNGEALSAAFSRSVENLPENSSGRLSRGEPGFQATPRTGFAGATRPWDRLDQALRAADLLLQGGGFAVIVFDLGGIAPEHALRIPAATWFRFRAAAESSGTAFILLSQAACARSSAGLVLHFKPMQLRLAGGTVVEAARYQAEVARQRFQQATGGETAVPRKQPRATWQASPYACSYGAASEQSAPASAAAEPLHWPAPSLITRSAGEAGGASPMP